MSDNSAQNQDGNINALVFIIDDEQLAIHPTQLTVSDTREQLITRCRSASCITVRCWEQILHASPETQDFLFGLMHESTSTWQFMVSGSAAVHEDCFAATLETVPNSRDLRAAPLAINLATKAAAHVCVDAAPQAAKLIKAWLARHGIGGGSIHSLISQIRSQAPVANRDRWSPQDAAEAVLRHLQSVRQSRGEVDISTPPLRCFQQQFYTWNGRIWEEQPEFKSVVCRIMRSEIEGTDLTNAFLNSVIENLKGHTLLQCRDTRPPYLIRAECPLELESTQTLTLLNGSINLDDLQRNPSTVELHRHDARVFLSQSVKYEFDLQVTCPLWERTLREIFPSRGHSDHRIEVLQEFLGYCLMPNNHRLETFVIFIGDGANGKSVVLEVARAMLGSENVSNVPLDAFSSEFRLAEMIGKLANIATDMQRLPRVQEGILKQLVSGEALQINRKYKEPVTMYPTAKLLFGTNHLPPFCDTSDGIWRRMQIIPFYEQFQNQDRDLHRARQIIETELPGVLNWALQGASRLIQRAEFSACTVCQDARSQHRHDSDAVQQFIEECLVIGDGEQVLVDDAYTAYKGFCESIGKMPKARPEFGKLIAKLPGVERGRATHSLTTHSVRRPYVYYGMCLAPSVLGSTSDCRYTERQYQPPRSSDMCTTPQLGSRGVVMP